MAPDAEIVRDRLNRVRRYVGELKEFAKIEKADFLGNVERQYAVLHALQLAIEASIEVAMHICSADGLGVAASYAEAFDALERAGVRCSAGHRCARDGSIPQPDRSLLLGRQPRGSLPDSPGTSR